MKHDTKITLTLVGIVILFFIIIITILVQSPAFNMESPNSLCEEICERKGYDFVSTQLLLCKCLTEGGDLKYFQKD